MTEELDDTVDPSATEEIDETVDSSTTEDEESGSSPELSDIEKGRQSLIDKLDAGKLQSNDGLKSEDEEEEESEKEQDDSEDDTTEEDEESTKEEESDEEESSDEEDSEDDSSEEDKTETDDTEEDLSESVQKRFDKLANQRREVESKLVEAQAKAQYVDDLQTRLKEKEIPLESMDEWVQLGFNVQENPGNAGHVFLQLALNMGMDAESISQALGIELGGAQDGTLDADLQQMLSNFEITEEVANKLQAKRKPAAKEKPAVQMPPQQIQQAAQKPATQAAPVSDIPSLTNTSGITEDKASEAVALVDAEYLEKYPNEWPKWRDELKAKLAEQNDLPFHLWGSTTRNLAELVVKTHKQAPKKPTRKGLTGTGKRKPSKKSKEPSKANLLDRISGGTLFDS